MSLPLYQEHLFNQNLGNNKIAKFKNPFAGFTVGKLFVFVVATIILIQVVSLLISSVFKDIEVIKTGWLLILISTGLVIIFLTKMVFRGEMGKIQIFMLILLITVTVVMYIYGSTYFPQIFSFIDSSALESSQALQSLVFP